MKMSAAQIMQANIGNFDRPHPSNCIGRKELSYGYIKPDAMTRAMTFGKGLSESEVVY